MNEALPSVLPVIGLSFSVLLHIAFVWLGIFGRHLGPLVASSVIYWIAVGLLALNNTGVTASVDRVPLAALSVLSCMALSYCYFTFVNLAATSLRIRLMRMLLNAPDLGGMPERMATGYTIADIVDIRIGRLKAWGYLGEVNGRMILLRRPMFYWIGIIVKVLRSVLGVTSQAS